MRTEDLNNFICVNKFGSLNKAAGELNISQQGLSRSIKSLEESVGARLFSRNSQGVELTSYGKEFLMYAEKVMADYAKLEAFVEENRQAEKKVISIGLRISANASPMSSAINNTVEDFGLTHHDVSIMIHSAEQNILLEELKSGELDIVQVVGNVDERQFDVYPIFKYPLYVIADERYKFKGKKITVNEIKDIPLVLPTEQNPLCLQILKLFAEEGIEPNVANYESSAKTLSHLVHRGNGIGFMPENSAVVVGEMYQKMKIYKLMPETFFCYSMVVNKGESKNPKIKELLIYLNEKAEGNLIPDTI